MEVEVSNHARKRKLMDCGNNSPPSLPPAYRGSDGYEAKSVNLSPLEEVEKSSHHAVEAVDLKTLEKLAVSFELRLKDNIAAVDLHDELQKLKVLAGAPELVASNSVPSIVNLLSHENADIANDVVQLLQDLTDKDTLEDNNLLELLIQNMNRLSESEPDEATAIYATLTVIENLVEVKPAVAELVCERTKLLRWLLLKIKVEGIKQYSSKILAILLQNRTANQKRLGQMNGVEAVLEGVAMYKDPKTPDEEEMLENLFDCLCCLLMPLGNKERFVNAEGVELMIIIMKQKKYAYGSAIRALDFAMTNYPPACERFVDVVGLKTAFAAFMDKVPLNKKIKRELEERVISLIVSLFAGISRGYRRDRLVSNFVENDYEKIGRLMELYIRHSGMRARIELLQKLSETDVQDLLEYHNNNGGSSWGKPTDGGSSCGNPDDGGSSFKTDHGNDGNMYGGGLPSGKEVDGGSPSGNQHIADDDDEFVPYKSGRCRERSLKVDVFVDLETVRFRDENSARTFRTNVTHLINAKPPKGGWKYQCRHIYAYMIEENMVLKYILQEQNVEVRMFPKRMFQCQPCRGEDMERIIQMSGSRKPRLLEAEMLVAVNSYAVRLREGGKKEKILMIISNDPFFKGKVCRDLKNPDNGGFDIFMDIPNGMNVVSVYQPLGSRLRCCIKDKCRCGRGSNPCNGCL